MHLIGDSWIEGQGDSFSSINPATGKEIYQSNEANKSQVDAAIRAARVAFSGWRLLPTARRQDYIYDYQCLLKKRHGALAEAISLETGKPLWEAKTEVDSMISKVGLSLSAYADRTGVKIQDLHSDLELQVVHRPHGVMAVFGPYNLPGHLPNGHFIPALLAGNTVVFKPSEQTPFIAELITQCWVDANLPSGVFNLIQGGRNPGKDLANADINGLLFTGSHATGMQLQKSFATRPDIILALELGGNNPLIVIDPIADAASILLIIESAFLTSGQRCTCARRLFIPIGNEGDDLLDMLCHCVQGLRIGAWNEIPEPYMGPVISPQVASALMAVQENLMQLGGKPLHSMKRRDATGSFLTPAIIDVTAIDKLPDREYFGPLLQVIRYQNYTEAIALANSTKFGLAAGLLGGSKEDFTQFGIQIRAGIINWNRPLTGASGQAPFGGIGQSGNHRPAGYYAADYCAHPVASLVSNSASLPPELPPGICL